MQNRVAAQRHKLVRKLESRKVFEIKSVNAICVGQEPSSKLGDTKKNRGKRRERRKRGEA